MFSKEESAQLRKEFWTSFGKSFPRKWIRYNTDVKGFSFKFQADRKKALVCLDFEHPDDIANELLYDQLLSLKKILESEYLPKVIYHDNYELDSGKFIFLLNKNLASIIKTLGEIVLSFTQKQCLSLNYSIMSMKILLSKRYRNIY